MGKFILASRDINQESLYGRGSFTSMEEAVAANTQIVWRVFEQNDSQERVVAGSSPIEEWEKDWHKKWEQ